MYIFPRCHFGSVVCVAVSSSPCGPTFSPPRVMSSEGVFSGDWQRRQASRLDNTARKLRAPESASGSGWAASAASSDWHPEETVQAEFGRMRLAAAQPASFSPERYLQYIRGRPVVVLMLHIQTHGFGSACDIIHMHTVVLYTTCMRLIYLGHHIIYIYCTQYVKRNLSSSPVAAFTVHT